MRGLGRKPTLPKSLAEDHTSTQALITSIETKDRRFRFAQTVFMVGTFVALIIVIGAQQKTLNAVQTQLEQSVKTANAQAKRDEDSSARIERRLDCMVVFFSQKDRAQLSIDNIDRCTINRNGDIQQFFRVKPDGSTQVTPVPQSEQTPATNPSQSKSSATPVLPAPVATGGADPNRGLFGWGVCAPVFTGLCL